MIVQAVVILLIILIVANIGVGFYNQFYPPCFDADEYFKGARKLSDGAVVELGSIPSSNYINYTGLRTVETNDPNAIGIKSWNSVYGESGDSKEIEHPIFDDDDDSHDTVVRTAKKSRRIADDINPLTGNIVPGQKANTDADDAYDAISAMYPATSQLSGTSSKKNTNVGGKLVAFEEELEGVKTKPKGYIAGNYHNPTVFKNSIERDGYS